MIITLFGLSLLVIGILCLVIYNKTYKNVWCFSYFICFMCGSVIVAISIAIILVSHVFVDNAIEDNNMEYLGLVKQTEMINSEYEDMSKATIIKDVTEWNIKVYNDKYWSKKLLTNWFYNKKVVDSLKYIELEYVEGK